MNDIDIQKILDMNYRALTLLGIATFMIVRRNIPDAEIDWFVKVIDEVIYKGQPIRPFPDKEN